MMKLVFRNVVVCCVVSLVVSSVSAQTPHRAEDVGLVRATPDSIGFNTGADNQSNWEGYMSKTGDGTIILCVNTFADGDAGGDSEVAALVVMFPDGSIHEFWGFYSDDGSPYTKNMDIIRTNGNPPSVAGDKRPGSRKFIVGNEATPMDFDEFQSDGRWDGNDYSDHIFAVQILEMTDNGPVKVSNVIDPAYGGQTGQGVGKIRKGGTIGLSNGNFVAGGEDRTGERYPNSSIINGEDGSIVAGPMNLAGDGNSNEMWEGLVAYDGGFAIRLNRLGNAPAGEPNPIRLRFYTNAGEFRGEWIQDTVAVEEFGGEALDLNNNPNGRTTTINEDTRGDSVRVRANIDGNALYYAGRGWDLDGADKKWVYLTKIDATTMETIGEIRVNELAEDPNSDFENWAEAGRVSCDVDPNGNVTVVWSDTSNNLKEQVIARIFNSDMEPVTPSFLAFQGSDIGFGADGGEITDIETRNPDVAMTSQYIMISAIATDFTITSSQEPAPAKSSLFTVLENPLADSDVSQWSVY
ncbi:MAG: hypothetical protein P9L94_12855 [Candidatus Hinthialibacter antarcticus]|nr:hypothetical protein [Candidatus Hinthialibacter antarcticus]